MKYMNYLLGSALLLSITGTSYGCNLEAKNNEKTTLVTPYIKTKPANQVWIT